MSMYVSMSRLRVDGERADELIHAFRGRAHLVDDAAGFIRLEVWQGGDPGEVVMVSWWRDRASFSTYMKSAEHRVSHDRIPRELQEAIHLERLESMTGYECVAE